MLRCCDAADRDDRQTLRLGKDNRSISTEQSSAYCMATRIDQQQQLDSCVNTKLPQRCTASRYASFHVSRQAISRSVETCQTHHVGHSNILRNTLDIRSHTYNVWSGNCCSTRFPQMPQQSRPLHSSEGNLLTVSNKVSTKLLPNARQAFLH